jgi:hypothetical protein
VPRRGLRAAGRVQRRPARSGVLPARGNGIRAREAHAHRFRRPARFAAATFEPEPTGLASQGSASFIASGVEAVGVADRTLADLQDRCCRWKQATKSCVPGSRRFGSRSAACPYSSGPSQKSRNEPPCAPAGPDQPDRRKVSLPHEAGLKKLGDCHFSGAAAGGPDAVAQSVRCPEQRLGALIGAVDPVRRPADEHHHPDGPTRERPGARLTRWDQAREGLGPGRLHRAATVQRLHTRP